MANRTLRIQSVIAKYITEIVQYELKNPKIGFVTISEVKVSSDHSYARVYVTFLNAKNPAVNLKELEKSKGFVRSSLAKKLDLRRVPEINFLLDDSYKQYQKIDEILKREEDELNALKNKK